VRFGVEAGAIPSTRVAETTNPLYGGTMSMYINEAVLNEYGFPSVRMSHLVRKDGTRTAPGGRV